MKRFLIACLLSAFAWSAHAGGISASFTGQSPEWSRARPSTVYEYIFSPERVDASGDLEDASGNGHTATDTNSPTYARSTLHRADGTYLDYFVCEDTGDPRYGVATNDAFKIWDSDHTFTILFMQDAVGYDIPFSNGSSVDGMLIQANPGATTKVGAYYGGAGTDPVALSQTDCTAINQWNVVQVVRDGDTATVYCNGVAGTGVDVAGFGTDAATAICMGDYCADVGGTYTLQGGIRYIRLDGEALTAAELAADRNALQGILSSKGGIGAKDGWTFTRAREAVVEDHDGTMHMVGLGVPRSNADGLLIEPEVYSANFYSEAFDSWGSAVRASVVANSAAHIDPWGTYTADILHEDGTGSDVSHAVTHSSRTTTIGEDYTVCVSAQPLNRDWIYLSSTSDGKGAFFNVDTCTTGITIGTVLYSSATEEAFGWCRVCYGFVPGNATTQMVIYIAEANNDNLFPGLNQDSLVVWGFDWTETSFPATHIYNGGVGYVTKPAEVLTIDPQGASDHFILPETFDGSGVLTVEFDMKCEWVDDTDIGQNRHLLEISANTGTASATRNRVLFQHTTADYFQFYLRDDADADHQCATTVAAYDANIWQTFKFQIDFSDLSTMNMWVDGSDTGVNCAGNSGTATFDTSDTLIRLGQNNFGTVEAACQYKNLRIVPESF